VFEGDACLRSDVSESDPRGLLTRNGFFTQRRKEAKKTAK
jgi:hypothetical protein